MENRLAQDFESLSIEERRELESPFSAKELRESLDSVVHVLQCQKPNCKFPNCFKANGLFRHSSRCKIRPRGGCFLCRKLGSILKLHARVCKEPICRVPHCRLFKEYLQQEQPDAPGRAALEAAVRKLGSS